MLYTFLVAAALCGHDSVAIPRSEEIIKVDGYLTEPVWQQAVKLTGFHQYDPTDGLPAPEETEVLIWYSHDAIHFGIIAKTKDPSVIRATVDRRDKIFGDDLVIILLDTFNDKRRSSWFGVNPLGIQYDGVDTDDKSDPSPDFIFDSKGHITDFGYQVEIRIPFSTLRYSSANMQQWGLQIIRKHAATGYRDTWTAARRAHASFLAQYGTITGLHDLSRGVGVEMQPFVTVMNSGKRNLSTGNYERGSLISNTGINVKAAFTSFAVDATVNPDFSHIESDASQITVNERFALFLSEKRPFFLEGIEMFNTQHTLVYSRSIVSPIAGAKITGKIGHYSFAHLSAVDEAFNDRAFASATRARYDLWNNSVVGLLTTNKIQENYYNHVLAADSRFVFAQLYFISAQLGASWTRDSSVLKRSPVWGLIFDRTGRAWGFQYSLAGVGEDFRTDVGFMPRTNIAQGRALNRFSWYGKPEAMLARINLTTTTTYIWDYSEFVDKRPLEETHDLNLTAKLRTGWSLAFNTGAQSFVLDNQDKIDGLFYGRLNITTPVYKTLQANIITTLGDAAIFSEGVRGKQFFTYGSITYQPLQGTKVNGSLNFLNIHRSHDGSLFTNTIIPRLRIDQQVGRSVGLRVISEYVSSQNTRRLRLDWLAYYEPRPGTIAYLGYGSSHDIPPGTRMNLKRTGDGVFVKIAYQFRRT